MAGVVVSQSSTGPHNLYKPHTQQQPQTQAPSSVTTTLHKDYTSNKPPDISPEPLQPATTTLTHENSQIHITTSQPQENSQQYTQPQLQHIHPQACLYFFLPFCSMHLCPLFHLHMQPHVGPLFPSLEFSIPLTVLPNHKLAFPPIYYKYCSVSPSFCPPISSLGIKKYCLALVISLIGYYISHPSYLVCTSNQSGLTPSPESEPLHHPLSAPVTSLGFHHPL